MTVSIKYLLYTISTVCSISKIQMILPVNVPCPSLRSGRRSELWRSSGLGGGFRSPSDSAAGVLSGQPADQERQRGGETFTGRLRRHVRQADRALGVLRTSAAAAGPQQLPVLTVVIIDSGVLTVNNFSHI